MTAHLADESRLAGIPELAPTLVRWQPGPDAAPHLAVGLDRLRAATREETLLVVTPEAASPELLERVHDVRRAGATIFALDADDPELDELAHEALPVRPDTAPVSFDAVQHLVSSAAGDDGDAVGLRYAARHPDRDEAVSGARPGDAAHAPGPAARHRQRHAARLACRTGLPDWPGGLARQAGAARSEGDALAGPAVRCRGAVSGTGRPAGGARAQLAGSGQSDLAALR